MAWADLLRLPWLDATPAAITACWWPPRCRRWGGSWPSIAWAKCFIWMAGKTSPLSCRSTSSTPAFTRWATSTFDRLSWAIPPAGNMSPMAFASPRNCACFPTETSLASATPSNPTGRARSNFICCRLSASETFTRCCTRARQASMSRPATIRRVSPKASTPFTCGRRVPVFPRPTGGMATPMR